MENEVKSYGKCSAPEGELDIIDYFQTENIEGRSWSCLKLEDNTFVLAIESKPENSFETVKQQMRLSLKSFAMLALVMAESDRHFTLNLESVLTEMLKGETSARIRFAKKDSESDKT
jgi:hypothetical protein